MKEYRLNNFAQICAYIFAAGLVCGAVFSFKTAIESITITTGIIFHFLALACIGVAIVLFKEIRICRFVITTDKVYLVSIIYKRSLHFHQIKGWCENENEIHILPSERSLKKIPVSVYFQNIAEIRYLLSELFPNVDASETAAEEKEIMENEAFGASPEVRGSRLESARRAARYTEWLGWGIAMWLFLYPHPYTLSVLTGALFPFLAIGVCFRYRGLIRGDGDNKTAYPSVLGSLIVVLIMMGLRPLLDINTISYRNGWLWMALIALLVFVLYQIPTNGFSFEKPAKYATFLLLPIFTFAFGFGIVTLTNSMGDSSEPNAFLTIVTEKRVSKGKAVTYHLTLKKWDNLKEDGEVNVSRSKYEETSVGERVTVYQYPGLLGMPWLEVD